MYIHSWILLFVSLLAGAGGAVLIVFGFRSYHRFQIINDTPTSKLRSMAMGLVEIYGQVTGTQFLRSPFSGSECVYYRYVIKEYRKHTRTDSKGRTHTHYSWDTVGGGARAIEFIARDDTGEAMVNPTGADIDARCKKVFYQQSHYGSFSTILGFLDSFTGEGKTNADVSGWGLTEMGNRHFHARVGDRKYFEHFLEPGEPIYLMGTASGRSDAPNGVVIGKGENEPTFIISYKSEKELLSGLKWKILGQFLGGSLLVVGAAVLTFLVFTIFQ